MTSIAAPSVSKYFHTLIPGPVLNGGSVCVLLDVNMHVCVRGGNKGGRIKRYRVVLASIATCSRLLALTHFLSLSSSVHPPLCSKASFCVYPFLF